MLNYIVERPNISIKRGFYPPKNKEEFAELVKKAKIGNLHETSKTQCICLKNRQDKESDK